MKIKKQLAAALALLTLTASSASAEHPSAQRYREMLQSDNFYLEYEMVDENKKDRLIGYSYLEILSSEDKKRMASSALISREKKKSWAPGIFGMIADMTSSGSNTKRGAKTPKALLANGNYYIFQPEGGSPFLSGTVGVSMLMDNMSKIMKKSPKFEARVCPAARLNAPGLDPTEGWNNVRGAFELPDALTVFTDDDPYQEQKGRMKINPVMLGRIGFTTFYRDYNMPPRTSPAFVESRKVTLEKKEYDCDRYAAEIKTVGGTVAAQILYDVMYDENGKLSRIHRYFSRNGREESLGRMEIWELTAELPADAFTISSKPIKVYAAGMGDANDFLGIDVQIGTIGGASTNGK